MNTNINEKKYQRYVNTRNPGELIEELDDPQYANKISTLKADEALAYLKQYVKITNEFEKVAAQEAVIMAIDYLTSFELKLKKAMIEGIAEDARRAEIAKKASIEAKKLLDEKIEPTAKNLIEEFEKLNAIEGYSRYWLSNDFEALIKQISDAAGLIAKPSVMISPR